MITNRYDPSLTQSEMPVSDPFHDLVAALATKLDETKRYDDCERHAHGEGKHDIAAMFARIASRDRHSIEELMQSLSEHQTEERVHSIFADGDDTAASADVNGS